MFVTQREPSLTPIYDLSYLRHDSYLWYTYDLFTSVTWLIHRGWRRLIGSRKMQIISHKTATKYRSLLLKMTYKDKGSYESSPLCSAMPILYPSYLWLEPYDIHVCDTTHSRVWNDLFIRVTWLIHMCDMTDAYVWHDSFTCVTWLIHMCDMTHSYVWHGSFICVKWLTIMCDMTHSYVWHDSLIRATWLTHMCDVNYMCDMIFVRVTRLIQFCDITHSCVWPDSFIMQCPSPSFPICDMTRMLFIWGGYD